MSGGKMIRKLLILLCLLTLMLNGCASEKTKQTAAQENDTEEDSGEIIVMQADYDYDIADVPKFVIDIFEMSGICIRELEERIMTEDIVYGD